MTLEKIDKPVLFLVGPTAIGKTALSIEIAKTYNCEVVSMDSMQVYRGMDVGTAKITADEMAGVPHHLIDIVNPDENYDGSSYARDALLAIENIHSRGKIPLVTGGTGLYMQSLCQGFFEGPKGDPVIREALEKECEIRGAGEMHAELVEIDPEAAARIHSNDTYRVLRALEVYRMTGKTLSSHIAEQERSTRFTNALKIGLTTDRERLYERINLRTDIMLDNGLEEEVKRLLAQGYGAAHKSMGSIGYKHMMNYLVGEWSYEEMRELLARDTRRYAKRQYTWFNKEKDLLWFDVMTEQSDIHNKIKEWLS